MNTSIPIRLGYRHFTTSLQQDVIANLKRIIRNEDIEEMHPSYRNFKGEIVKLEEQKYVSVGKVIRTNDNVFQVFFCFSIG